ncbi:uncharacterized protein B0I36DRAFT_329226 [Microdochium trichocladiopsis]|uniref:Uncharacterized protein n=1 Tax=Microdochium trichocladiopsis TaxID=1682393 RepID=A0A9P8XZ67_9PEZI|nr:uncharacterized protein B0I36DRAFT_329226 [Microdochium trichocladiopsis]KAH7025832.1 hypothetical protein B0I36DRAFT_329226 [Microdochium trichocladiopsis]
MHRIIHFRQGCISTYSLLIPKHAFIAFYMNYSHQGTRSPIFCFIYHENNQYVAWTHRYPRRRDSHYECLNDPVYSAECDALKVLSKKTSRIPRRIDCWVLRKKAGDWSIYAPCSSLPGFMHIFPSCLYFLIVLNRPWRAPCCCDDGPRP